MLLNFVMSISEHQDWFGVDENLGPLAISIRRERVPHTTEEGRVLPHPLGAEHYMYRLIVRYRSTATPTGGGALYVTDSQVYRSTATPPGGGHYMYRLTVRYLGVPVLSRLTSDYLLTT